MGEVKQETTRLTVDEYIQLELTSERRHEYINGQLIEMPGEKDTNNQIAGAVFFALHTRLLSKVYQVYAFDVKLGVPDGQNFFYPKVFVTREPPARKNEYIKYEPEMIVEVLSPSSHIRITVDKYIAYTSIPSLNYYLIVEPETFYVTLYAKNAEGKWEAMSYVRNTDVIPMPLLEVELPLSQIYQ